MQRLTDAAVRNAKPRGNRYEISEASGLALRVAPKGTKSWVWRYRFDGKQKRLTLGSYPQMSLSEARAALASSQDKLARGHDPGTDRPTSETVADLVELYHKRHLPKLKSAVEQERRLRVDVLPALGHVRLTEVTRRRVSDLIHAKAASAPVSANRLRSLLAHLFSCAVSWGLLEQSPVTGVVAVADESSRKTTLADADLGKVWLAALQIRDARISRIIRLLILTGQRVSEVCGIELVEVDFREKLWMLPAARAKNSRDHVIPLSNEALSIVGDAADAAVAGFIFPAVSKRQPFVHQHSIGQAWRRLSVQVGIEGVNPHDIRRTVATGMGRLGVQPHVIEAVLNHVSGHRAGVAGVYQRHDYLEEKRAALESWGFHVERLMKR